MSHKTVMMIRSLEDSLAHGSPRVSTATAKQAIPSPRPSAPSCSARRPLTVTGAPAASDSRACIASRIGASLGSSQTTEQSTLPTSPALGRHVRRHTAQQLDRVGAGDVRIGVGEPLPDVAQPRGAEQRLDDGVGDGVAVAVADEPRKPVEPAATEHQRPVRIVAEAMDVEPLPHPHLEAAHEDPPASHWAAHSRSSGSVILRFHASPGTVTTTPPSRSTSAASSVPSAPSA